MRRSVPWRPVLRGSARARVCELAGVWAVGWSGERGALVVVDIMQPAWTRELSIGVLLDIQMMACLNLLAAVAIKQNDRLIQTLFQYSTMFWNMLPVKSMSQIRADRTISHRHERLMDLLKYFLTFALRTTMSSSQI